jgi:hypothetical protein
VLSPAEVAATAATIVAAQRPDGAIPWLPGGEADPWNHVEAAMGLTVAGRHAEAAAAYRWLARAQNADGSFCAGYGPDGPTTAEKDSNFTAYVAVGVLHFALSVQDNRFLSELWPTVRAALDHVRTQQLPEGQVRWRDTSGSLALLAGNSSIHRSLRAGARIAETLHRSASAWTAAADRIATAITTRPALFEPKPHAMDWYYPALGGVLSKPAAIEWIDRRWAEFVEPGLGVRCVDDQPWVTGGETAELVLTLASLDRPDEARTLFDTLNRLRRPDGGYVTGYQYANQVHWPTDTTTWTAGAVLLANAALDHHPATSTVFRPLGG